MIPEIDSKDNELNRIKLEMIFAAWDMKDAIWMQEDSDKERVRAIFESARERFYDARARALEYREYGEEPFKGFYKLCEPIMDKIVARLMEYKSPKVLA